MSKIWRTVGIAIVCGLVIWIAGEVYFRTLNDFLTKMEYEKDHISVARRHEQAFQDFKRAVEAIYDCPKPAREAANKEENLLKQKVQKLREENKAYDAPGGPHVLQKKK